MIFRGIPAEFTFARGPKVVRVRPVVQVHSAAFSSVQSDSLYRGTCPAEPFLALESIQVAPLVIHLSHTVLNFTTSVPSAKRARQEISAVPFAWITGVANPSISPFFSLRPIPQLFHFVNKMYIQMNFTSFHTKGREKIQLGKRLRGFAVLLV